MPAFDPGNALTEMFWDAVISPREGIVKRTNVDEATPADRTMLVDFLRAVGIGSAQIIQSQSTERFQLQIDLEDAQRLELVTGKLTLRRLIQQQEWKAVISPKQGGLVFRLDVHGLDHEKQKEIVQFLKYCGASSADAGRSPTFKKDYIQIKPEDMEKLTALKLTKETAVFPQHQENKSADVVETVQSLEWGAYNSPIHDKGVMRANVGKLSTQTRTQVSKFLHSFGIKSARIITSDTDGQSYMQVAPDEAEQLQKLRIHLFERQQIRSLEWEPMNSPSRGGQVMRAEVSSMNDEQRMQFLSVLEGKHISAELIHSKTFGTDFIEVGSFGDKQSLKTLQSYLLKTHQTNTNTTQQHSQGVSGQAFKM